MKPSYEDIVIDTKALAIRVKSLKALVCKLIRLQGEFETNVNLVAEILSENLEVDLKDPMKLCVEIKRDHMTKGRRNPHENQ